MESFTAHTEVRTKCTKMYNEIRVYKNNTELDMQGDAELREHTFSEEIFYHYPNYSINSNEFEEIKCWLEEVDLKPNTKEALRQLMDVDIDESKNEVGFIVIERLEY